MQINRNNYEMFFLDFWEDTLREKYREELTVFLEMNPDLQDEFLDFKDSISVRINPENTLEFSNKNALKKPEIIPAGNINEDNYEDKIIASLEGDLTSNEYSEFTDFKSKNPQVLSEINLYKKTFLKADQSIVYFFKRNLKRTEIPFAVKRFMVFGSSIAAMLLLALALFFPFRTNHFQGNAKLISQPSALPNKPIPPKPSDAAVIQPAQIENTERLAMASNELNAKNKNSNSVKPDQVHTAELTLINHDENYRNDAFLAMIPELTPQQEINLHSGAVASGQRMVERSEISEVFGDMILRDVLRTQEAESNEKSAFERVLANLGQKVFGNGEKENAGSSLLGQVAELGKEKINELTEDSPRIETIEENGVKQTYFSVNENFSFRISKGNKINKSKE